MKNEMKALGPLLRRRPDFAADIVFDVGANVGGTTLALRQAFPRALIYAFEPVRATFARLQASVGADRRIELRNLALGSAPGDASMELFKHSVFNRIAKSPDLSVEAEKVSMTTGDLFCAECQISAIDFLKIDTEGHDLEVLLGFERMLSEGAIRYVQTECGFGLDNDRHVPFNEMYDFMRKRNYTLFGIFDPVYENHKFNRPTNGLWFANPLFVYEG